MEKVCVVTGGGSGIGKAVAAALPKDHIVVITGRTVEKLQGTADELNAQGCRIVPMACDVSRREDVARLAADCAALGEIDTVVHCAGVSGSVGNSETIYRTNALGTVHVNQEFYKVMNGGVICDTASDSGYFLPKLMLPKTSLYKTVLEDEDAFVATMLKKTPFKNKPAYAPHLAYMISKNFARWYSANCAFKYMATKGIRVFSVSPGFVKTPMTEKEQGEATEAMLSYSGLKRGAEAEELAFLITSLCDPRCGYLLGADIICDGGVVTSGYGLKNSREAYSGAAASEKW